MNINEAKQKLHDLAFANMNCKPDDLKLADVMQILNQIDTQPKPRVPEVAVEFYETYKDEGFSFEEWFGDFYSEKEENFPRLKELAKWLYDNPDEVNRQRELALATLIVNGLDAVEVEQERLYVVTDGNKFYLKEFDELNAIIVINDVVGAVDYAKRYADKAEAQKAADELGWVVKEVE
ncbi:hypothetical protein [Streptococcus suis]|uniref:hypothetical protein n=1 Tax=Streptococcus suis TaxID=1307 RepID=UPI00240F0641|nr:hypothetical protein [Streptococcus suis]MDG3136728.1 hypothetical protein [Streptococcus suis]